ncbi:MAG: hypothetical protein AAGL98_09610, partial [Planctomycetota bacterium]
AAVALELIKARRKATVKFPGRAETLIADAAGVEQASSLAVARHKAGRFRDAGFSQITDVCCGIGGDAMGLSAAGLSVAAVDLDPVRAWMAGLNAGCTMRVADAAELLTQTLPGIAGVTAMHVDPARRTDAGRVFRLNDYQPGPATLLQLLDRFPDAGIKLSPAVNLDELEAFIPTFRNDQGGGGRELEFISEAGRLVQAVLWTGRLARPDTPRSATLIVGERSRTVAGVPSEPGFSLPQRYLFTVDAAAERAGLLHTFGLPAIHPRLGLLTSDLPDPHTNPWLTGFELLAELPWHSHEPKKVRDWLHAHDAGIVEVKTRGKAVDPDHAQRQLRGPGVTPYTVFVLRFDQRLAALITRRLPNTA